MTQSEFLNQFERMSIPQQLDLLKSAIQIVEKKFQQSERSESGKLPLDEAAKLLLQDYMEDENLTSFTALDGEDFYAAG